jgi:hypothetical protein
VYEFKGNEEVTRYLQNLQDFERKRVPFWPTIQETILHGDKFAQTQRLDAIASVITKTPRPVTEELGMEIPYGDAKVLKRSFSDGCQHVIFLQPIKKGEKLVLDEKPEAKYLIQGQIQTLQDWGELRVAVLQSTSVAWMVYTKRASQHNWSDFPLTSPKRIVGIKIE